MSLSHFKQTTLAGIRKHDPHGEFSTGLAKCLGRDSQRLEASRSMGVFTRSWVPTLNAIIVRVRDPPEAAVIVIHRFLHDHPATPKLIELPDQIGNAAIHHQLRWRCQTLDRWTKSNLSRSFRQTDL